MSWQSHNFAPTERVRQYVNDDYEADNDSDDDVDVVYNAGTYTGCVEGVVSRVETDNIWIMALNKRPLKMH